MKRFFHFISYIQYKLKAKNAHGVHSPFVFDLLQNVIYNYTEYYAFKKIETLRIQGLKSTKKVTCVDLGAGSSVNNKKTKKISRIVKHAAKSEKYAQLLFRLVNYFQPETVIELGTSAGITTCYLASANSKARIITIEGCEEIAAVAKQHFEQLEISNIEQHIGNFDDVLPTILSKQKNSDFVFFDGNHRKQATLNYFNHCLQKINNESVFIFDDIYWSVEMKEAWQEIKNNNQITVTIDLFFMGIVFFRKEQVKQHFVIRF